jgi:hypothetical protein
MQLLSVFSSASGWIEAHGTTVGLLKWAVVGLLAWGLGVFRYLKARLKRPQLEIESFTSRCVWRELGVVDGKDNNVQVVFLIEAGINNPTSGPIVVRDFTLELSRLKRWRVKNHELHPASLPNRVRHSVGGITKLLKNWFSNFPEGPESLTLGARIEAKDHQSGFLLFVSVSYGYMRPRKEPGYVVVKLRARLTTGEVLTTKGRIAVVQDQATFESMVPGLREYVESRNTWNIIRAQA